jgi:S-adenosyl-L-methionine hydrolase (adenosine-forming)
VSVEGEEHDAQYATTFADVAAGELLLYEDAYRTLALAVNRGSAADRMALGLDDEVRLRPTGP